MKNLYIIEHPLIQHKLNFIRREDTAPLHFRQLLHEVSLLMTAEFSKSFRSKEQVVQTPLEETKTQVLDKAVTLIPIMRAGMGMADSILSIIPTAHVAHIGLYRDEQTKEPVEYYFNCQDGIENSYSVLIDPMLATGGSASAAANLLKKRNIKNIRFVCLIAAPEGVERFHKDHPEIDIYTAALDSHLDENAYIRPGLGDAGDRIYNTVK